MKPSHTRTLQLNNDFSPHSIISWDLAITAVMVNQENSKEGVFAVDFYKDEFIKDSRGHCYPIPAVVALAKYVRKGKQIPFSRKNVFQRDKLTCQYCNKKFHPWELTYDHVIPRCMWDQKKYGTPTHWGNIVTCCTPCNKRKAGRTPEQAKMHLIKKPVAPAGGNFIHGLSFWSNIEKEWIPYLPEIYVRNCKNGV